jgi:hypothetical protein
MSNLKVAYYRTYARNKGLSLWRNQFTIGWSIVMPGGGAYHAHTDDDMIVFLNKF